MSKAVLVIDMPETCEECVLNSNNHGRPDYCKILIKPVNYIERRKDCPLMPAPEEQEVWYDDSVSDWDRGYNSCLREIMGEENEVLKP